MNLDFPIAISAAYRCTEKKFILHFNLEWLESGSSTPWTEILCVSVFCQLDLGWFTLKASKEMQSHSVYLLREGFSVLGEDETIVIIQNIII